MKTPFKRMRGLGLRRNGKRHRHGTLPQLDELSHASQDMQDMRDCYDSLLSAAAGTTNSAYEFSESLQEMGDCLLGKTALSNDEDSGRVLRMLGQAQFDVQKLVDNYRVHISRTITVPSESLLNELRIVEDMKRQCDEKRMTYEAMKMQYDKGRLKSSKGEYVSSRQLQSARDEFDEDATLFVFRMNSLKRGQSRSLLTQAARHHAAQMCFFRKALKSLEAIEPHIKLISEQRHIDYHFSGLEDDDRDSVLLTDDEEEEDDSDDYYDTLEDGELKFECRRNDRKNEFSSSGNSMEANMYRKPRWNSTTFDMELKAGSKSAPLSAERNERFHQSSSTRKLNTYVLPTPLDKTSGTNMWHSSPLEHEKILGKEKVSGPIVSNQHSLLKDSNNNCKPTPLPTPPRDVCSSTQVDSRSPSSAKKMKRYTFSGPLTGDSKSNKPLVSARSTEHHLFFSGSLLHTPLTDLSSTPKLSSPTISELHELPTPPAHFASKKPSKVGFSAPLVTFKSGPDPTPASTLPEPSRSQRDAALASKPTESRNLRTGEGMVSPISLKNI